MKDSNILSTTQGDHKTLPEENNKVVGNALVIEGLLQLLNGALLLHLPNHVHELKAVT